MRKALAAIIVSLTAAGVLADPVRPQLTKENRQPSRGGVEVGAVFRYQELVTSTGGWVQPSADRSELAAYLRYGVLDHVTLLARAPYVQLERAVGRKESGPGDVALGFECVMYEDILDYPWVMAHGELSLATGDEEKGLGEGDASSVIGLAVGTTVKDVYHFNVDARYEFNPNSDNRTTAALSVIWDVSKQFSVLAEAMTAKDNDQFGGRPVLWQGGLVYRATEWMEIAAYSGAGHNSSEDRMASLRLSLLF